MDKLKQFVGGLGLGLILAALLVSMAGCGGGGGGGSSSGGSTPPGGGGSASENFTGTKVDAFGLMSGEGNTSATIDTILGTITFHTVTEGTVTCAEPNGSYRSSDGLRLYTVTFNPGTLRLSMARTADNSNMAVWQLTALSGGG